MRKSEWRQRRNRRRKVQELMCLESGVEGELDTDQDTVMGLEGQRDLGTGGGLGRKMSRRRKGSEGSEWSALKEGALERRVGLPRESLRCKHLMGRWSLAGGRILETSHREDVEMRGVG